MAKGIVKSIVLTALLIIATNVSAAIYQQIQVANMLYNQDATGANPGMSPTSVLVKGFVSGSGTACYSATIPFQSSISITTGTGQACSTAIATMTFTPVAIATVGTAYTAPATLTLSNNFTQQLLIQQTPKAGAVSFGPVFDATNGVVVTPGTVTVSVQADF